MTERAKPNYTFFPKVKDINGDLIEPNDLVLTYGNEMFRVTASTVYLDEGCQMVKIGEFIVDESIVYWSPDEVKLILKAEDSFVCCAGCGEFVPFYDTDSRVCFKCIENEYYEKITMSATKEMLGG